MNQAIGIRFWIRIDRLVNEAGECVAAYEKKGDIDESVWIPTSDLRM
jgi:hypothetical protein